MIANHFQFVVQQCSGLLKQQWGRWTGNALLYVEGGLERQGLLAVHAAQPQTPGRYRSRSGV